MKRSDKTSATTPKIISLFGSNQKIVMFIFTLIRILVGWHFLYEGFIKLFGSQWTSRGFLVNSQGPFARIFHAMADFTNVSVLDFINIWGLILIGLGLVLGVLTRYAIVSGIILLSLYYLAFPPVIIVNQTLIEVMVLVVLLFLPADKYRLDHSLLLLFKRTKIDSNKSDTEIEKINSRRGFLKSISTLPLLGAFGYLFYKNDKQSRPDAISGASYTFGIKTASNEEIESFKGKLPKGTIKNMKVSRLLLGGHLVAGSGHVHQLKYLRELGKAYNTKEKAFSAMYFAEQLGINSIIIDCTQQKFISEYKRETGGKIQSFVSCPSYNHKVDGVIFWDNKKEIATAQKNQLIKSLKEDINVSIDSGADVFFAHGTYVDYLMNNADPDIIGEIISYAQSKNLVCGMAGHMISAFKVCEKMGYNPDFYMKTIHHDKYPSATPLGYRDERGNDIRFIDAKTTPNIFDDNMWCPDADAVAEFMQNVEKPWLGYKVLAGGAIQPADGFKFAFDNGAEFIGVGMYDFQIFDNVKTTVHCLDNLSNRRRGWYS